MTNGTTSNLIGTAVGLGFGLIALKATQDAVRGLSPRRRRTVRRNTFGLRPITFPK